MNYTRELELLITETLLPVYYRYHEEHGSFPEKINEKLLKEIKTKVTLPRILTDKKDWK